MQEWDREDEMEEEARSLEPGPYPNDVANNVFGPINVPTISGFPVGNDDEHFDGVWPGPHILPEDLCPVSRKGKCERFPRLCEASANPSPISFTLSC